MSKPIVLNAGQTVVHQAGAAALSAPTQLVYTQAVASNADMSGQLQHMLARGMVNPDDVRAFKGV